MIRPMLAGEFSMRFFCVMEVFFVLSCGVPYSFGVVDNFLLYSLI